MATLISYATCFTTKVLIGRGLKISTPKRPLSRLLPNELRYSKTRFPKTITSVLRARTYYKRIVDFLATTEIEVKHLYSDIDEEYQDSKSALMIDNGMFSWNSKSEEVEQKTTLRNIFIDIPKGHLVAVIGKVGSGKSLLYSILGDIKKIQR
jgi:ABC-type multidrug transport system fused ATPase/permease subunit